MLRIRAVAIAALLEPSRSPAAQAHVTLQPEEAPAGGFTRLDVRVPNERDNKGTTKVHVQMPPGFIFASYEPIPGWEGKIEKRKLAEPVEAFGEEPDELVMVSPGQSANASLGAAIRTR